MKTTREMYDRLSATEIRAFQLRARDGAEYAVVIDGEIAPGIPDRIIVPTSEIRGRQVEFDTTNRSDPT